MSVQPRFGKTVQQLRIRRGITQRSLADQADITVPYLCQLEHGEGTPSLELVERLAKLLETTVPKLLS
jgi:transcriptional regulator with XRE-family HTH domain